VFTCVGWQVILCDPIGRLTLVASLFLLRTIVISLLLLSPSLLHSFFIVLLKFIQLFGYPAANV